MLKSLAPHSEYLAKVTMDGTESIAIIYMGKHAQERSESFQIDLPNTCYLPSGHSPRRYLWPVMGCKCYLLDTSESAITFIKTCVLCLFEHGATQVHYFSPKFNRLFNRS